MATKKAAKSTRKTARKSKAKPAAKQTRRAAGKRTTAKRAARPRATAAAIRPEPMQRVGLMELSGKPATIVGPDVVVGQAAPDFTTQVGAWAGKDLWQELSPLAETAGKVRILAAVPS